MKNKRKISVKKQSLKMLDYKIQVPTIECKDCGEEILDTPTNRMNNFYKNNGEKLEIISIAGAISSIKIDPKELIPIGKITLVKDTQLYKDGLKLLEAVKIRSYHKIDLKKDKKRSFFSSLFCI